MAKQLHIGAYGWRGARWAETFYPEDMPQEWQLAFYASEFADVLVPAAYWDRTAWPDVAQWCEDAQGRLGIQLEAPAALFGGPDWPRFLADATRLGERLVATWVSETDPGRAAELASAVYEALPRCPVYGGPAMPGLAPAWRGLDDACPCAPLGLIALEALPPPKALRALIERFAGCCSTSDTAYLFLDAPVEVLRQAITMTRLLGL
jgi:hypothetical protein